MKRIVKNSFWILMYMLIGIAYAQVALLFDPTWLLGLLILAPVSYIVVSKLRERMRF